MIPMQRRILAAVAAVVLAVVGAALLIGYVSGADERARAGEDGPLRDLLPPGTAIDVVTTVVEPLAGPQELVERLAASAWRGDLLLFDATDDGGDVVVGVAWSDEPATRAAEVRVEHDDGRIVRVEWLA